MAGIETNYVGMSTAYGTCEAVPVYQNNVTLIAEEIPQPVEAKDEVFLERTDEDTFTLVAGSAGGAFAPDPMECASALSYFATLVFMRFTEIILLALMTHEAVEQKWNRGLLYEEAATGGIVGFLEFIRRTHQPRGLENVWKMVLEDCGPFGGGLAKKLRDWLRLPLFTPGSQPQLAPRPVPVARRVPIEFHLPELSPEVSRQMAESAVRAALVTAALVALLASLDMAVGRATGLFMITPTDTELTTM